MMGKLHPAIQKVAFRITWKQTTTSNTQRNTTTDYL